MLIRAFGDVLPASIANRPKRGFSLPHQHWMAHELAPLVEATCHPEVVGRRNLLDPAYVARVWQEYQSGGGGISVPQAVVADDFGTLVPQRARRTGNGRVGRNWRTGGNSVLGDARRPSC